MSRFFASRGDLSVFYALFNGQNGDGVYAIGAATRMSGSWSEHSGNPVLSAGSSGAWDDSGVKDPCLLWDGSQYVMYFSGYDGATFTIGRATAPSVNGPWTKYASNPVINVGAGGAVDDGGANFPTVLYEPTDTGKEWKCWYGANDGATQTVAYAHSSDGITWTKVGKVVDIGAGGTWNDVGVLPGAIYKQSGTYYLFVAGRQNTSDNKWQGGLWTFTDPEGVYTANGGNPIMLARFNDAPISFSLTANTSAGGTTATIADTTKYNVGEPIVLYDGDTAYEIFYVTSKTATVLTLDHATTGAFTTAQSALVRPFAMVSIFPRSVLPRASGGYEAMMSLFQPVEDLTLVGTTKLGEGAFEMRASALTGTWSYYYVAGRGLLFPLTIGASWCSRSAENPSVIAAP